MWATLRKKIQLEDPSPLVDQENLGSNKKTGTVDEETMRTHTEMLQTITTSNVERTSKEITWHNIQRDSMRSYDMKSPRG